MLLPSYVKEILDIYAKNGHTALVVGGSVRDALLGIEPHDYDIATSALPHQTKALFPHLKVLETGLKHGTLTLICEGNEIEVTVFRKDGEYTDNRRPDSVTFTEDFTQDAQRRDFTVNAMGYSPATGLLDPCGGKADLEKRVIRAVGDPATRFREDGLRIMRAIRFASQLGFEIEKDTENALFECKDLLKNIAAERIFEELLRLLSGKNVASVLTKYCEILGVICPEILPAVGFEQNNPYHKYDVLTHTAIAVAEVKDTPLLKLTAFFHDLGKPLCYTEDGKGGHFYGHAKISAALTEQALARLKAPTALREGVVRLTEVHDLPLEESERFVKRQLNRLGEERFLDLIDFQRADNAAQSEKVAYRRENFDRVEELAREIIASRQCFSLKDLALKGDHLTALGLKGKEVGKTLDMLLTQVIEGRLKNEKDILIKYTKNNLIGEKDMELKDILSTVDHTLLKTDATFEQIKAVLDEAMEYGTASACIPPCYVKQAAEYMGDKGVVCTVIGFPNGYSSTESKCFETAEAVKNGAKEIDMVINHGMVREGRYDLILEEINAIKKACNGMLLKVIIETCIHSEEEKIELCKTVAASDADYIKTSTGFSTSGATREDVALLVKYCVGKKVKAAGGIKSLQDAEDFITLGASRLGTSSVIKAVKGLKVGEGY